MAKLTSNVHVGDTWYGPDYPDAGNPPADAITNPAAFADPAGASSIPFRADDFEARGLDPAEGIAAAVAEPPAHSRSRNR